MARRPLIIACAASIALSGVLAGCDNDATDDGINMKPRPPQETTDVVDSPGSEIDIIEPQPAYVTIVSPDGIETQHEFPPAMLWLEADPDRPGTVKARLFSDDPAEATERGYLGSSFFFEMRLDLPPESAALVEERLADGGDISPEDVADAEWVYQADETEQSPTTSQIALAVGNGVTRNLRPRELFVNLRPLAAGYVDVTLLGDFAEGDAATKQSGGNNDRQLHAIHVRAVLTAKTVQQN